MTTDGIRYAGMTALTICAIIVLFFTPGCSSSSGSTDGGAVGSGQENGTNTGENTVQEPDFPPGKFTVQLGAYQSEDAAREIATVAGSRFVRKLYTVYDAIDRLYKVMLGMFDTKDQAREFRDTIVRQYTEDYRDAWVSELTR